MKNVEKDRSIQPPLSIVSPAKGAENVRCVSAVPNGSGNPHDSGCMNGGSPSALAMVRFGSKSGWRDLSRVSAPHAPEATHARLLRRAGARNEGAHRANRGHRGAKCADGGSVKVLAAPAQITERRKRASVVPRPNELHTSALSDSHVLILNIHYTSLASAMLAWIAASRNSAFSRQSLLN